MSDPQSKSSWWSRLVSGDNKQEQQEYLESQERRIAELEMDSRKAQEKIALYEQKFQITQQRHKQQQEQLQATYREKEEWQTLSKQLQSETEALHTQHEASTLQIQQWQKKFQTLQEQFQGVQDQTQSLKEAHEALSQKYNALLEENKSTASEDRKQVLRLEQLLEEMTNNLREESSKFKQMERERLNIFRQKEAMREEVMSLRQEKELTKESDYYDKISLLLLTLWQVAASALHQSCGWSARLTLQDSFSRFLPSSFFSSYGDSIDEPQEWIEKLLPIFQQTGLCQSIKFDSQKEKVEFELTGLPVTSWSVETSLDVKLLQSPVLFILVSLLQHVMQRKLEFVEVTEPEAGTQKIRYTIL